MKAPHRLGQTGFVQLGKDGKLAPPTPPTAPCVPGIRDAVSRWVQSGYNNPVGCTDTTRILLNYWFRSDHRLPDGRIFAYNTAQREAMETLAYLYEIAKVRNLRSMLENYATDSKHLELLQHDEFTRYCFKMATGSGKTKVMALAMAWQYFNAILEKTEDYARTALVIAPNVIVFDRLRLDYGGGRIFRSDPIIPPEFSNMWDFECYVRGDAERPRSEGALYLTNIQQLYERSSDEGSSPTEPSEIK